MYQQSFHALVNNFRASEFVREGCSGHWGGLLEQILTVSWKMIFTKMSIFHINQFINYCHAKNTRSKLERKCDWHCSGVSVLWPIYYFICLWTFRRYRIYMDGVKYPCLDLYQLYVNMWARVKPWVRTLQIKI